MKPELGRMRVEAGSQRPGGTRRATQRMDSSFEAEVAETAPEVQLGSAGVQQAVLHGSHGHNALRACAAAAVALDARPPQPRFVLASRRPQHDAFGLRRRREPPDCRTPQHSRRPREEAAPGQARRGFPRPAASHEKPLPGQQRRRLGQRAIVPVKKAMRGLQHAAVEVGLDHVTGPCGQKREPRGDVLGQEPAGRLQLRPCRRPVASGERG